MSQVAGGGEAGQPDWRGQRRESGSSDTFTGGWPGCLVPNHTEGYRMVLKRGTAVRAG